EPSSFKQGGDVWHFTRHLAIPLSQWANQTVTVTFSLYRMGGYADGDKVAAVISGLRVNGCSVPEPPKVTDADALVFEAELPTPLDTCCMLDGARAGLACVAAHAVPGSFVLKFGVPARGVPEAPL